MKLIKLSPRQIQSHNKIGHLINTTDKNFNIELINYYLGINYNHYEDNLICDYIKNNINELIEQNHSYKVFDILYIEKLTIFTNIEIRNNISHVEIQENINSNSKYIFYILIKENVTLKNKPTGKKLMYLGKYQFIYTNFYIMVLNPIMYICLFNILGI